MYKDLMIMIVIMMNHVRYTHRVAEKNQTCFLNGIFQSEK